MGLTSSNSSFWYNESALPFAAGVSASITGIRADVTVRAFDGVPCPANTDDTAHTQVEIGGNFFNGGDGTSADDVLGFLIIVVDTNNPTVMNVGNYWGWGAAHNFEGVWTPVGSYPLGTPLVASFKWDRANHQFVATVKVKGDPSPGTEVVSSYGAAGVSDQRPAADPTKNLYASTTALNCTTALSGSHVDALFDNVIVSR